MKRPPIAWILLGLLLGIATTYAAFRYESSDLLVSESLTEARARWEADGPESYDIVVQTSGSMVAEHRIEVRNGAVQKMTTGGKEATPGSWEYWSVDGLFDFLATEIRNGQDSLRAYGVDPGSVVLRVRFNDEFGYPEFFLRHVLGKGMAIEWRVEEFSNTVS